MTISMALLFLLGGAVSFCAHRLVYRHSKRKAKAARMEQVRLLRPGRKETP